MKNYVKKLGNVWPKLTELKNNAYKEKFGKKSLYRQEVQRFTKRIERKSILWPEGMKERPINKDKQCPQNLSQQLYLTFVRLKRASLESFDSQKKMKWSIDFKEMTS